MGMWGIPELVGRPVLSDVFVAVAAALVLPAMTPVLTATAKEPQAVHGWCSSSRGNRSYHATTVNNCSTSVCCLVCARSSSLLDLPQVYVRLPASMAPITRANQCQPAWAGWVAGPERMNNMGVDELGLINQRAADPVICLQAVPE